MMPSSTLIILCAALASAVLAAPPSQRLHPKQPRHVDTKIPLTLRSRRSLHPRQSTEQLPEVNEGKFYTAAITLGDSGQPFNVLFDTGSADLWIPSAASAPAGHSGVDLSDTSIQPYNGGGVACSMSYGPQQRSVSGTVYVAPYNIAATQPTNAFCLVDQDGFGSDADGIIGLGPCAGSGVSRATGDQSNCPLLALGWNLFGLYISSDDLNGGAVLTPNGADQSLVSTDFFFEPVLAGGQHWAFSVGSYSVNGQTGTLASTIGFVDSGTPVILLDAQSASNIWSYVGADVNAGGQIACGQSGPDIIFTFGSGQQYNIPWNIWNIQNPDTGICRVAVQPFTGSNSNAVFGAVFTKAWYTLYDLNDSPGSYVAFARSVG